MLALCWHQSRQDGQFSVPDPFLRPKTMKNPWFFNVAKMKPGDGEGHKPCKNDLFWTPYAECHGSRCCCCCWCCCCCRGRRCFCLCCCCWPMLALFGRRFTPVLALGGPYSPHLGVMSTQVAHSLADVGPYLGLCSPYLGFMSPMSPTSWPMLALCWRRLALSEPYVDPCSPYVGPCSPHLGRGWPYVGAGLPLS